jgi:hypothetical protein
MDPHCFEDTEQEPDICKICSGHRSDEWHQAFPPRGFVDVRSLNGPLEMLDKCKCGAEYITHLHMRHECPDCIKKWLYPPDGIKPKSWQEELGDGWKTLLSFLKSLRKK